MAVSCSFLLYSKVIQLYICVLYIYICFIYIYICKYIYLPPGKTWCEQLTHLKRPWCWERLGTGGEGDDRGWDGWMASLTQWTWVWLNSGSWWWTGRPGMLWFMGSQGVGCNWVTELNLYIYIYIYKTAKWFSYIYIQISFPGDSDAKESACNTGDFG